MSCWISLLLLARAGFSEETEVLAALAVAGVLSGGVCVLEA